MASRIISIDVLWFRFRTTLGHGSRGNGWYAMASEGQWWQASSSVFTYYGYVSCRRVLQFGQYWTMGAMTTIGMQWHHLGSVGKRVYQYWHTWKVVASMMISIDILWLCILFFCRFSWNRLGWTYARNWQPKTRLNKHRHIDRIGLDIRPKLAIRICRIGLDIRPKLATQSSEVTANEYRRKPPGSPAPSRAPRARLQQKHDANRNTKPSCSERQCKILSRVRWCEAPVALNQPVASMCARMCVHFVLSQFGFKRDVQLQYKSNISR